MFTQLCLALCEPVDCSPPGSSVHGILQARILECVAMPSSRGSSQPRDWTHISCICSNSRWILYHLFQDGHNRASDPRQGPSKPGTSNDIDCTLVSLVHFISLNCKTLLHKVKMIVLTSWCSQEDEMLHTCVISLTHSKSSGPARFFSWLLTCFCSQNSYWYPLHRLYCRQPTSP